MKKKKIDQLSFSKDRVVCISLKSHDDAQLSAICDRYSISFESVSDLKSEGIHKIWIEEGSEYLIAFTTIKESDYINICENYCEFANNISMLSFLRKVKQQSTPKIPKRRDSASAKSPSFSLPVVLEVDAILDKIFKYGIDSITEEEKSFLDNQ